MTRSIVAPLFRTDGYKLDHRRQYPAGTTRVYSNYTNRSNKHMPMIHDVVHFGLQAFLQRYLTDEWEPFFAANRTTVAIKYAERLCRVLGPELADDIGTDHICALHELGYLPLQFRAFPEGTLVPIGVPSWTVENTVDEFFWVTNFIETGASASYWPASTCATVAREYRKVLLEAAGRTGADPADVDWQAHGFEYRGMFGGEAPEISGAAHLLSFNGTDSLPALEYIDEYYGGFTQAGPLTIPATEHSVMSAGIAYYQGQGLTRTAAEAKVFEHLLDLYPNGNLAVVSDTFDLWAVLTQILPSLKDKIMARDGKLLIRPDSGDPEKILCGDKAQEIGSDESFGVVQLLADGFGTKLNREGFHSLDSHVGAIYGDSINLERVEAIPDHLARQKWVSTVAGYGTGSYTYHFSISRDSFGSAMKATAAKIDGKWYDLFKDPVTDDGTKRSAKGRLAVLGAGGELFLKEQVSSAIESVSLLQPVWEDGKFLVRQTFDEVRAVLNDQ